MARKAFVSVLVALGALGLSSCATSSVADHVYSGLPEQLEYHPGSEELQALWLDDSARFAVVTWGSSSCPSVATKLTVEAADQLQLTFGQPQEGLCTADMAATTHEFVTPGELTGRPVHLTVRFDGAEDASVIVLD